MQHAVCGFPPQRGARSDYNHWAETVPSWSWDHVAPYFDRSLDYRPDVHDHLPADYADAGRHQAGADAFGRGGEWRVEGQRLSWDILDQFGYFDPPKKNLHILLGRGRGEEEGGFCHCCPR